MIDAIWHSKPKKTVRPFFIISPKQTGMKSEKKLEKIKDMLLKNKSDYLLITAPENIAWALNIRGHDSSYSPITNARLLISNKGEANLFVNLKKIKKIKNIKVRIHDEQKIQIILNQISKKNIWLDTMSCSFFLRIY